MASSIVNVGSFLKYISSLMKYLNGTALSSTHQTSVLNYYHTLITAPKNAALNIKTAAAIINRIRSSLLHANQTYTIPDGGSDQRLLSVNTAKSLIAKMLPTGDRNNYTTVSTIFNSTAMRDLGMGSTDSFNMMFMENGTLTGTLYGGGGGGSGACVGAGGKNANITLVSGAGSNGTATDLKFCEGPGANYVSLTANGGAGGDSISLNHTGDGITMQPGNAGKAGSQTAVSRAVIAGRQVILQSGRGGAGGGGAAASADSGTITATAASGQNGGKGAQSNSYSGSAGVFGSGGGAGTDVASRTAGTNASSGASGQLGTLYTANIGSATASGRAGYSAFCSATAATTVIGAAGAQGACHGVANDDRCHALGGNGGGRGGFVSSSPLLIAVLRG